jgi:hypothetical protein
MKAAASVTILIVTLFVFNNLVFAQEDHIPRNIERAYEKGTRSLDGSPGPNYWQNSSDYHIKADFNPGKRLLNGSEQIIYHNNSPDTLNSIVLRLYQNLNKATSERNFNISSDLITNGMTIEKLMIDDKEQDLSNTKKFVTTGTLFTINIKENPVMPHSNVTMDIDWNFKLPEAENIRMGTYDSTSFLLGYWYPQVSVYDDIDGWDMIPYTGMQEFYNDFSNYDVELTVPNNFEVWGTGVLQNPEEIFTEDYLKRYKAAFTSDSIIRIITKDDLGKRIFNDTAPLNTWKFNADNITDVVYGTSDHYLWDATSLEVEPGRRVYIAAAYKKESQDFYKVAKIARHCIKYFSTEMPAVPFPFPSFTVFNGSGGMEFPMLINDGSTDSYRSTIGLTSHETAHQYFPFYMGTNEQKYAWMDEGWAVFLPTDLELELLKDRRRIDREAQTFSRIAGTENDIPLCITTDNMRYVSYRLAAYTRPGLSYLFLRDALGSEKFKKALHIYMKTWHGKHPIPYDYFFSFNNALGRDLSWFWDPWYFQRDFADLSIKNVVYQNGKVSVEVVNAGKLPVPVNLIFHFSDGTEVSVYKPTSVWEDSSIVNIEFKPDKPVTLIEVGAPDIPDSNPGNNSYEIEKNQI